MFQNCQILKYIAHKRNGNKKETPIVKFIGC